MMNNIFNYCFICTALILCGLFSTNLYATTQYQRCSEQQTQQLIKQFSLKQANSKDGDASYISCLNLNSNQSLIAISNPTHVETDYTDYDLKLYLLDRQKSKIIQKYQYQQGITSDANHFDGIQFDINPFSTTENQNVIGLALKYSHLGAMSYEYRSLYLFSIQNHLPIKLLMNDFMTDFSGNDSPQSCGTAGIIAENKILIIPQKAKTFGYEDLMLKQTIKRETTDAQTCKVKKINLQKSFLMKFDGKQYQHKHLKFLDYGL